MKFQTIISTTLISVFILTNAGTQKIIHVPLDYSSIQKALDNATSNSIIQVEPGTYYENIIWPTNIDSIQLIGIKGSKETIIDGSKKGRVIKVEAKQNEKITTATVIKGFTIQNGKLQNLHGAGLSCVNASPELNDLIFINNFGYGQTFYGGGAYLKDFSGIITNCNFINNHIETGADSKGAGLYLSSTNRSMKINSCNFEKNNFFSLGTCNGAGMYLQFNDSLLDRNNSVVYTIEHCNFIDNYTTTEKGAAGIGLFVDDINKLHTISRTLIIESCEFRSNKANNTGYSNGGGMITFFPFSYIRNSNFFENSAVSGGGIFFGQSDYFDSTTTNIQNCNFTGNKLISSTNSRGSAFQFLNGNQINVTNTIIANNDGTPIGTYTELANFDFKYCTIFNNEKNFDPYYNDLNARNCIFWNKSTSEFMPSSKKKIDHCIVKGGFTGLGNIDKDPKLKNGIIPIPEEKSPCLNAGIVIPSIKMDILGNDRPMPSNSLPDIGAIEVDNYFAHVLVKYYYDINQNGKKDANEKYLNTGSVEDHNGISYVNIDADGTYIIFDQGPASLKYIDSPGSKWKLTSQASFSFNINSVTFSEEIEFGLYPSSPISKLSTSVTGDHFKCGEQVEFILTLRNDGTQVETGSFWFELDNKIDSFSFSVIPDKKINNHKYEWNFTDLYPDDKIIIKIYILVPRITMPAQFAEKYYFCHGISPLAKVLDLCYVTHVKCSFDPNDKTVFPQREDDYVLANKTLFYTVRFQNTGNDYAQNVIIKDTIDPSLNIQSLHVLHSSHLESLQLSYNKSREVTFEFKNIFLPDSSRNEKLSHGYVTYSLEQNKNLPVQTEIDNTAHIIFDRNPAITTNTTKNIVIYEFPTLTNNKYVNWVNVYPIPATEVLNFSILVDHCRLYNLEGKILLEKESIDHIALALPCGIYILYLEQDNKHDFIKIIIE